MSDKYYKHNTKEIYACFAVPQFSKQLGNYWEVQWEVNKELKYKRTFKEQIDLSNFHEISFEQWQRWRIHEVIWDNNYKYIDYVIS